MVRADYSDRTLRRPESEIRVCRRYPVLRWSDVEGEHHVLIDGKRVIGSAPEVDVLIADRTVSRLHAELEPSERGTWIRDLSSLNGTYVNGLRVSGALLVDRAAINLGATKLGLFYDDQPVTVELWPTSSFHGMVGGSPIMRELFARLAKVASVDSNVMILGETGTGKELVARAIHDASARVSGPFVVVDCAALPVNLVEAELFGHSRGAFTGAVTARAGAFEEANGGTIFLDEVGELPLHVQPKLLRVLEAREIRRVGETRERQVDVRVISATHRDLREMVNINAFREDLYFRLAVLPVHVAPLRERKEDIPLLTESFLRGRELDCMNFEELSTYPWLGNVRELRNFVERVCALGADQAFSLSEASPAASAGGTGYTTRRPSASSPPPAPSPPVFEVVQFDQPFKTFREAWAEWGEREYLIQLLDRCQSNVAQSARTAEVDRTYLYRLMRKHRL